MKSEFFLTGNYILVAILLLVLLRLCYQTVVQRLEILKVLCKRKNRCSPKNPIKFKGFLDNKIQRGSLHQTLEAGPSAPGAPSSF